MDIKFIQEQTEQLGSRLIELVSSPAFYSQIGIIILTIILAYSFALLLKLHSPLLKQPPSKGPLFFIRNGIYQIRDLLFPLFIILFMMIAIDISNYFINQTWLVRICEGLAVVLMIYSLISRFVSSLFVKTMIKWIAIPIAILQVFGWLDLVTSYMESLFIEIGNIKITAYGVARVMIFGVILFWLGRISNNLGQKVIRQQETLDIGTREVFAKLYQVTLFVVIFILLLQVMGINITALAVFGGALGVGLGFGLQSIASNFISGIILLLDRSLAVGDYIELADGRKGTIRELNMRSTTLETYDGKDIMVPNEQFITTSFTNWTHKNKKQRYSINFQVAYSTDLHKLFEILKQVVSSHPKVLSGPDLPIEEIADAEISGFGDSGVNILIEFWMEGIDDGEHRVGGDLLLMIWDALKENHIEIPFPQREIKIVKVGEGIKL
ncbi:MAG: mechanosensitive ion channel [Gammaproteobacteria bacterium]|nr:mechanosensitive ion channel [Gammaproteobacteria bacterium]MCW8909172.1 mechanosensitive ion channel [Gammaproteobacteria bacterium]MCW9005694.1 mechanosensitive ion channel [Gammaproteobacteria bacterium]MCW9055269.1 mechanosensitive ion channel [Gammaproteobacteria bacterium]